MNSEIQILPDRSALFVPMSVLEKFDEREIASQISQVVEESARPVKIVDLEKQTEIVDGKVEVKEMPELRSSGIAFRIGTEIGIYLKINKIGRLYGSDATFTMMSGNERMADVAFVFNEKLVDGETITKADFAPDLAVEVISPSDTNSKVVKKVREYFAAGVRRVWLVEPELETVTVYLSLNQTSIFNRDEILTDDEVLPSFELNLREIFID